MAQKISQPLLLAGRIIGATLLISLIVLAAGLFLHWEEPMQFSNGFFAAGGIVIVLSVGILLLGIAIGISNIG